MTPLSHLVASFSSSCSLGYIVYFTKLTSLARDNFYNTCAVRKYYSWLNKSCVRNRKTVNILGFFCVILGFFFVTDRQTKFASAHVDILDCTLSDTLCALSSHHRLQFSSRLEHLTVCDIAHFSFADGTFHAARLEVRGIFKCAHQHLGLYSIWHRLRPS